MSNVEHPNHYQLNIKLEVLDIINLVVSNKTLSRTDTFIIGNAIKYLLRSEKKNGIEDIEKCRYYLMLLKSRNYQVAYSEFEDLILKLIKTSIKDTELSLAFECLYCLEIRGALKCLNNYISQKKSSEE